MRGSAMHLVTLLALFGGAACEPPGATPAALPPCDWSETVRVIDGDTIVVNVAGTEEKVRYIGIDAPETSHPVRGVEPFGLEATAANRDLVQDRRLCLERDVTNRDRYGRLLRYAWLEDGTLVNEALLARGMAQVVTYPPDVKYVEPRFLPAQQRARAAGLGIWGDTAAGGTGSSGPALTWTGGRALARHELSSSDARVAAYSP
ncbi:MAG: thermonuclease family protein [Dehalococcoidia bacterium]|nr:thermonuclease family protein [Dehalococcoidia bacterium]